MNQQNKNMANQKIIVQNTEILLFSRGEEDFISLTDIARAKNPHEPKSVIQNWMRSKSTIDFLGLWEKINNPKFKGVEFEAFKNEAGYNHFTMSPKRWIEHTGAVGLINKAGRYGGGTFAHKDIAFEFASWISAEFKLYLIKEFQRLKSDENIRLRLDWSAKRFSVKANYRVHTDAVKEKLIPARILKKQINMIYADEADVLNVALFRQTAKEWRSKNPGKKGNMRDYADIIQLVCLAGLESLNAEFIRQDIEQGERLKKLNEIAIIQMRALTVDKNGLKINNYA